MARVFTLSSGSDGNCSFIGDARSGILIDLGISFKRIKEALAEYQIELSSIEAVLITHEHSDHIKGIVTFAKKTDIPIFASQKTAEYIMEHHPECVDRVKVAELNVCYNAGRTEFASFKVYHDSVDAVGYRIKTADNRIVAYSTDTGHIDDEVFENIKGADLSIIEANHDEGMLSCNVAYPYLLKKRILGDCGHLSNSACAKVVCRLYESGTRRFVLAHLSDQNNTPAVAYETVYAALNCMGLKKGVDFELDVAPRLENSRMMIF